MQINMCINICIEIQTREVQWLHCTSTMRVLYWWTASDSNWNRDSCTHKNICRLLRITFCIIPALTAVLGLLFALSDKPSLSDPIAASLFSSSVCPF